MQLLYDSRDVAYHEKLGSRIFYWLDDLGAVPLHDVDQAEPGFLFAGARPIDDYRILIRDLALVRDRPEEREPLLHLDTVLMVLERHSVQVPMPRTWVLPLDAPLPNDLTFPLFVRTTASSWKKGGVISRVRNRKELESEAAELRRALGWNATILVREWLNLARAGEGRYGPLPQEVRTWIVDGVPFAWSFHYQWAIQKPKGFPLSDWDLATLHAQARKVGAAFGSRLVAADFARGRDGQWWFIEAGPGSCAGTVHEEVFKAVARRVRGVEFNWKGDIVGGPL